MSTGGRPVYTKVRYNGRDWPGLESRRTNDGRTVYTQRVQIDKRRKRHPLAATTPADAVRERRKLLASLDAGAPLVVRSDPSLREVRDQWEPWARAPGSPYRPRTVDLYVHVLDHHAFRILGAETKAANVRAADLRRLIDKLNAEKRSGSYVHNIVTALSALLRFAVRRGIIESNPTRLLERGDRPSAKRRREPRYLDRREIDRLLAKLSTEWRPLAAVLAFGALRVSEALALTWADVDFNAGVLTLANAATKTESSKRPVPMTGDLAAELRAHRSRQPLMRRKPDALVFQTANGTPHDRHNVARAIRAAGTAAKLNPPGVKKVAPHDLRHSCAGLLLAAGVAPTKVSAILRHADSRITLAIYGGLVESQRAELRADLEAALR